MQLGEFFAASGIVAYPLLGFSILTLALSGERLIFWSRINRAQARVITQVLNEYQSNPERALKTLRQHCDLPICRIFLHALTAAKRGLKPLSPVRFRVALESSAQRELPGLRRFSSVFDTIVTTSPLLGLLGTVLGLIRAFASLSLGNLGSAETLGVTGGVSEALISTVMGLVVAIVTLVLANLFRSFYRRQVAFVQESMGQLELFYAEQLEHFEGQYVPT
ncbi:MAG: MotA/TolQ/ExbB proton channel family protein [Gloeomargaritaceae cyanobacterium C42_A2020_066]|nr:MotA/TolQ/ExbB proton channel family protein [Gloeomargaritaceae cyanobacterium C42_A2020_066]